jgi:hypothetical protein
MMNLQSVVEGIISSLIATIISGGAVCLFSIIFGKNKILSGMQNAKFHIFNINPFGLGLFATSFFTILSIFSFYLRWENTPYLITITIFIWMSTVWIYHDQCPNCNKIFKKKHIHSEVMKEEKIPHQYYDEILYLYTDGTIKDREQGKKKKTWVEIVRTIKDHYRCNDCDHNWDSSLKRVTINESDRPKPIIKKTRFENPENSI